jgi:hypothetical protein
MEACHVNNGLPLSLKPSWSALACSNGKQQWQAAMAKVSLKTSCMEYSKGSGSFGHHQVDKQGDFSPASLS